MRVKIIIETILIACLLCLFGSCSQNNLLRQSLEHAGSNREELEKVLRHYEDDEAKRRAAVFLISNIGGRYSTTGGRVDEFHHFIDSVYCIRQEEYDIPAIYNTFRNQKQNTYASIRREQDLKHITAEYLIRHIDRSFELWKRPWNSHLSFEEFCEWILPYRLHDEQLESWHDIFRLRNLTRGRRNAYLLMKMGNRSGGKIYGIYNCSNI